MSISISILKGSGKVSSHKITFGDHTRSLPSKRNLAIECLGMDLAIEKERNEMEMGE
jgi:hypothetical protein